MKRVNLVYFSGTGGTARVANAFERSFASRSVAVSRTELKGAVDPALYGDLLVLLFPVYAFNAPKPVDEWLQRLEPVPGRQAVVVSVSGGGEVSPNTACRVKTIRSLEKKGYDVIYEKMLVMPSNFMIGFDDSLCAMVLHATPVVVDKLVGELIAGRTLRTSPYGIDRIVSKIGILEAYGGKYFGRQLKVDHEKCAECGWCEKRCPRNNIRIEEGQHIFGNDCVICLRCVYGCPRKAIEPGIGKFILVDEGFNLSRVEDRMDHLTVFPRITQATNHASLRGVRDYLIESECFKL